MNQKEAQDVSNKLSELGCRMQLTHSLSPAMHSSAGSSVFVACWHHNSNNNYCAGHTDRRDCMTSCPLLISTELLAEVINS